MPARAAYSGLLLLLVISSCFTYTATAQRLVIKKYTVNDGLADSYILSICQDSQGFLWVGTANGLSRFDGTAFINYGYAAGLPNLVVDAIYEDHQKRLWAGTRRGIVQIKNHGCIVYPASDHQVITFVFEIKELSNHHLVACTDKGLYGFNGTEWEKEPAYPGLENHHCRNIVEYNNGLVINYGDYLVRKDQNNQFHLLDKQIKETWYNIVARYNNHLYMNAFHSMYQWQSPADTIPLFQKALNNKTVSCFFRDSRGRFWINTRQDGLMVSAPNNTNRIKDTIAVAYNMICRVYEDRDGNIWVACFDGLMQIREARYNLFEPARYHLLKDLHSLTKTANTLTITTPAGFAQYANNRFNRIPGINIPPSPPAGKFTGIVDAWCNDDQGRLWMMMREGRLLVLEKNNVRDLTPLVNGKENIYWRITYNHTDHQLYVVSNDSLLCGDMHGFKVFKTPQDNRCVVNPRSIYAFTNGAMLVGTFNNHFLLITAKKEIQDVTKEIGLTEAHFDMLFREEPNGKFWIASKGGLARYYWNQQQLPVKELQITTKDGLPNDATIAITLDTLGRLWTVTNSGLAVIETSRTISGQPVVHRLSEEVGISGNQWDQTKLLTDSAGYVWMILANNLYRFEPWLVQFNSTPPSVSIEDIRLNLQPTSWNDRADTLYGYRQLPRQLKLPYHLNNLSIAYKAPCFSGSSGIEYSWQLEGVDSGWSAPTQNTSVAFVKLPSGRYRFKVKARKSNTNWGAPATFLFIIDKPYWETWWFRICVLAITTILLGFMYRSRVRRIQRKAQVREQLKELELKALRSQMNPHFIYNALNSIQALVLDNKPDEATRYIGKFGRLLRQVLNHSEQSLIPLEEELQALELYVQLEQLRLHVDLEYRIETSADMDIGTEWIPPLILQPFVENALWHGLSRKQGEKKLHITLSVQNNWLIAEITDNGIGRKQATGKKALAAIAASKGMDITERRIKEYNHTKGIVAIEIIDLYDTSRQPAGTKVVLRIKRSTSSTSTNK